MRLLPGVIAALSELRRAGYRLVMVSNQDGLGTDAYPRAHFDQVQEFLLQLFASQGVQFDAVFICPHFAARGLRVSQAAHRSGGRVPAASSRSIARAAR